MKFLKGIFLVTTAILILLPSAVSFSHVFAGHGHKLCDNYAEHHYHQKSADCDLHKFQKNPALSLEFTDFIPSEIQCQNKPLYNYYEFLNDYQALPFDLRGPPAIIA
ncbi:hypothetical protein [Christiangramia salexigens]|uniref:Uncharacterized protein n=1 Tax=Christiangramia salexigens TaxID=1913577 RepID=A0A1L3J3F4_9FLAO|nr:hypothetical protein [Christiangramia salexigens]APG59659.1 hypothetical protein LPB144_04195 [Christiangramia salexigens]